jgi:sulfur-oxidizing protein SoxX
VSTGGWAGAGGLRRALPVLLACAAGSAAAQAPPPAAVQPFTVVGDAIPEPLAGVPGDAARGRAIVASRQQGLCLLCHGAPIDEERFQGTLAPSLAGAGARWSAGQLRLRIVDSRRLNPATLMPSYHRVDGLSRVGVTWQGQPLFTAQQVEDVVAYLVTLRD